MLQKASLSIIVPSCGRPSLRNTLTSIAHQAVEAGDEIIVVGDGHQPIAEDLAKRGWGIPCRYLTHGPTRNFGNAQRTFAQRIAHGTHVAFMDDDDIYTEDAFVKIRKALSKAPSEPHVFKVIAPWREVVWTEEEIIEQGNCCTVQLVVPNRREKLPEWPLRQGGNIIWMEDFGNWIWRPEIIAVCRPYQEDLWWGT